MLESAVEAVVRRAIARPRRTLAAIAAVTLLLGLGLPRLRFETGILDWLPRGHPNVEAFSRLLEKLDGITNQELLWVELDPEKAATAGVESIHDPRAIRAQQELVDFVRARVPRIRHVFGLPHWIALVHRVNRGGDPAQYRLPDEDSEIAAIFSALWTANRTLLEPTIAADGKGALVGLVVEGNPLTEIARDVGRAIEDAVEEYKRPGAAKADLFRHEFLVPVGLASGTSLIDRSLRGDTSVLVPLSVGLVVAMLLLAFRRPGVALIGILALLLGVAWTFGLMGLFGAALNVVNVALVPLLLGCGIDYAIHVLTEFAHGRSCGRDRGEALRAAARSSGVGVVLTTATTVAGLATLVLSDSPGMTALGAYAAFGMSSLALISLTFIPAAVAVRAERTGPPPRTGFGVLGTVLGALSRRRFAAAILFAALTAALAAAAGHPVYLLDVIEGNYRPGEPVAKAVGRMKQKAGGAFPEFVIVEGDLTRPEAVRAVEEIKRRILADPAFAGGMRAASFADALGTYEILKRGSLSAVPAFLAARGNPANAVPQAPGGIAGALREMDADPAWRPLSSLFGAADGSMALVILIAGTGTSADMDGAERLWRGLEAAAAGAPPDLRVSFLGYRTMSYLFVSYSIFWLRCLFGVSIAVVLLLVAVFIRDWKSFLTVAALAFATGLWWLGLLRARGIYVSIFLLFPLVFVVCIGSDFAVHLVWRLSRGEKRAAVFGAAGRAILLSAVTDGLVFALFSRMRLVSASQVMESVALAVVAVLAATAVLVPAVYGGDGASQSGGGRLEG